MSTPPRPSPGPVLEVLEPRVLLSGDVVNPGSLADGADKAASVWDTLDAVVSFQAGDADGDAVVGPADLAVVTANYGRSDATWRDGDFNGDGVVGIADLAAIADHYGTTAAGGEAPAADGEQVYVSEFMAINRSVLADADGEYSDWIELHNAGAEAVDLSGWALTDDDDELDRWVFPGVTIPADGYLVVFASGDGLTRPGGELHANFKLDGDGEYLALVRPDGAIAHEYAPEFPAQWADVSYGLTAPGETEGRFFAEATPGSANAGGAANLGPIVSDLVHTPAAPADGEDLTVTAAVSPTFGPVGAVTLHYRVMYGAETDVAMFDDGAHGDGAAGDGVYGATIPAWASSPGQMIRWYVTAADTAGNGSRWPLFVDPTGSEEYLGTVVRDPSVDSQLPVYSWFVANPSAASTSAGTRASLFYDGEFYDNVYVRIRGGTARGYYKKNYKFDFNKGHWFRWSDEQARVSEINLNSTWADKAYVRQVLSFEVFRDAMSPYSEAFHVRLQQNGQFFSVAMFIEQVDERYLERQGIDSGGALYKLVSGHTPGEVDEGVEKKTRRDEDHSDLAAFYDGLRLTGDALWDWMVENVNIPEAVNYYAAMVLVDDGDQVYKNHYLYRDTEDTGLWQVFPWDKDLTFGRHWSSWWGVLNDDISYVDHPINGWWTRNLLGNAIINYPVTQRMYLARVRTLMDELLQPSDTPADELLLENRIDEMVALMGDDVDLDAARWRPYDYGSDQDIDTAVDLLKTRYLARRRTYLEGLAAIPPSQPASPAIHFGTVEYDPPSGNQDHEYIEIVNEESVAMDISGWRLAGGIDFIFAGGTVIPPNTTLYVTPNIAVFRHRPGSPSGGQGLFVVGNYSRHIAAAGEEVRLLNTDGEQVDAFATPAVEISEVMYGPAPAQQWIELSNPTDETFDIGGWYLSDDPAAPDKVRIPDGVRLVPGAHRLFTHAGDFGAAFTLAGEGGTVVLTSAGEGGGLGNYQRQVSYGPAPAGLGSGRYVRSDGQVDFVLLDAPTPGGPNADPWAGPVVINELMYHPPAGGDEFIELLNRSDSTVKLYDPAAPARTWRIRGGVSFDFPAGAEIAPGQAVLVVGVDLSSPADEAAFRAACGVAADVPIFGPYGGDLDDDGESVELLAVGDAAAGEGLYVLADHVVYSDVTPWPYRPDGRGPSLERVDPGAYGNEPANWQGTHQGGSPGQANVDNPVAPAVNAGADFSVSTSAPTARLDGTVTDDGLPVGCSLTIAWSFAGGPAPVEFDDPHDPRTGVTFPPIVGEYFLRLTGDDGDLSSSDLVSVIVTEPLVVTLTASPESGWAPLTVDFTADAVGGLPEYLSAGWYQYAWDLGDGMTSIKKTAARTFESYGRYEVRLTVSDGVSTDVQIVHIVVGGLPGDANGDGQVGIADLATVADNYGMTDAAWHEGDLNGDGRVGIADLSTIADHYGEHVGGAPAGGLEADIL